ncbi:MAG: pyridoxal 5'-phosphate synthase glutaminase subunit PdxT [Patescibacteria group bacterium]|nr:pyridoxal 5'-phosphate synthase glutaminase subunit PdxT [Patescibacteria group bacterium]MDE2589310.1 pyridoxal 5'-phosphate synthase glutaminase subunit PdxT [Patescibacteria group bacterium]
MNKHFPTPVSWELSSPTKRYNKTIGVLAVQGDFLEHIQVLTHLGYNAVEVRLPKDLETIDAIILPGGESTTQARLLDVFTLRRPLIERIKHGMPVWGTCAGMILLATKLMQDRPIPLGLMDITVNRNAFGRQIDSFEYDLTIKELGDIPLHATFIRAPQVVEKGPGVEILANLPDGTIVAAKQDTILVTSFHPELTADTRLHKYFATLIS